MSGNLKSHLSLKITMEYKITDKGLEHIGSGLAWLGFWIGLGILLAS